MKPAGLHIRAAGDTSCPAGPALTWEPVQEGFRDISSITVCGLKHKSEKQSSTWNICLWSFNVRLISTHHLLLCQFPALFWCTHGSFGHCPPDFVSISSSSWADWLSRGWHLFTVGTLFRRPAAPAALRELWRQKGQRLSEEAALLEFHPDFLSLTTPGWPPALSFSCFSPLSFPLSKYIISLSLFPPSHNRKCGVYWNSRYWRIQHSGIISCWF